ncbi:uncharacterized protein L969DRAFT_71887 [Mixia osmundae IAM 14324]|uniref:2Fe-2S ferredoxin-type domain-containing protein n=1 Tax=Mixia osmundae (strain CBS 9802 / IAM 14324 / JCM 22182 / KY 12970) TaxID=764103 RepID=G7E5Z3_MIXOS|nr:uncharacterized protein L969DRAFT_71887 [Mixia osmundae IAM 14324]KEI40597.1 hypothetical protein L969DRAFT_71887 [Mixia osmundae IAM 14324]GAA98253.1 hypothetical protein E5Q_04936 [Mixia osmundae IAM 14324]
MKATQACRAASKQLASSSTALPSAQTASRPSPRPLLSWQSLSSPSMRPLFASHCLARATLPAQRQFSQSVPHAHGGKGRPAPGTGVKVTVKSSKGEEIKTVEGNVGDDIVDLAWEYDLDVEAACEKSVACSTCHVILSPEHYDMLEEPTDEENDMLDLAFGLKETSRLGCQVKLTKELDGMTITLPAATRNMSVDGHKSSH